MDTEDRKLALKAAIKDAFVNEIEEPTKIMLHIKDIFFTPAQFYDALEEVQKEWQDSLTSWD